MRVTFTSPQPIPPGGLPAPFADGHPLGSALLFLLTPEAPVRLHRIRNDQIDHSYLGDPLELFLLHGHGESERVIVGPDLRGGQQVDIHIPGNTERVPYGAGAGARKLVSGRQHDVARRHPRRR